MRFASLDSVRSLPRPKVRPLGILEGAIRAMALAAIARVALTDLLCSVVHDFENRQGYTNEAMEIPYESDPLPFYST